MLVITVLSFTGASLLVSFFTNDEEVKVVAKQAIYILSSGYVVYGIGMVLVNTFNGAGDTWTPTWINLFCFWLFQIPLAYFLSKYLGMGPKGVFMAIPISEIAITTTGYILFKRGNWKKVKV
jgi:Na+-driven multidrug efflux pump